MNFFHYICALNFCKYKKYLTNRQLAKKIFLKIFGGIMNKGEMLKEIRRYYRLDKNAEFARFFELSEQTAYSWTKRATFDIELVYEKCPEISPDWLLSHGENGPMLRSGSNTSQSIVGNNNTAAANGVIMGAAQDTLNKAFESLAEEQRRCAEMQAQQARLIELLDKAISTPKA